MNYLTADQELMDRLAGLMGPVEIRTADGKVLGRYTPAPMTEEEARARAAKYFDLAAAEQALGEKTQGCSVSEVWKRIQAVEQQG